MNPYDYTDAPPLPQDLPQDHPGPWEIWVFKVEDDQPDWWPYSEYYRSRDKALARCQEHNERVLRLINAGLRDNWQRLNHMYLDRLALFMGGRLDSPPRDPGPAPAPLTELPPDLYCERFGVAPMTFEDDVSPDEVERVLGKLAGDEDVPDDAPMAEVVEGSTEEFGVLPPAPDQDGEPIEVESAYGPMTESESRAYVPPSDPPASPFSDPPVPPSPFVDSDGNTWPTSPFPDPPAGYAGSDDPPY